MASSTEAIETVDQLFDIRKGDEDVLHKRLAATVLYAVACCLNSKDGNISVEGICTIAGLFFENPLGDEKEYSSRLDELIETSSDGRAHQERKSQEAFRANAGRRAFSLVETCPLGIQGR